MTLLAEPLLYPLLRTGGAVLLVLRKWRAGAVARQRQRLGDLAWAVRRLRSFDWDAAYTTCPARNDPPVLVHN